MNRSLQFINFFGVLVLAGICIAQWRSNRADNLEIFQLEKMRLDQAAKLAEQEKIIQGNAADLDTFREQLIVAKTAWKEGEGQLKSAQREITQLQSERDQLRESVTNWANAVALRDERIQDLKGNVTALTEQLNGTIQKFNELGTNYGTVVRELNERTRQFNELVVKYNETVKPTSTQKN
jgi:chromosome segregation ATPase